MQEREKHLFRSKEPIAEMNERDIIYLMPGDGQYSFTFERVFHHVASVADHIKEITYSATVDSAGIVEKGKRNCFYVYGL